MNFRSARKAASERHVAGKDHVGRRRQKRKLPLCVGDGKADGRGAPLIRHHPGRHPDLGLKTGLIATPPHSRTSTSRRLAGKSTWIGILLERSRHHKYNKASYLHLNWYIINGESARHIPKGCCFVMSTTRLGYKGRIIQIIMEE